MEAPSPVSTRLSEELDRMEQLLKATAVNTPIKAASPFPLVHLNVAACYEELRNSKGDRAEDIVMRQALELYCSLISPPTTPMARPNRQLEPSLNSLPVTSDAFYYEKDDPRSSIVYPSWEHGPSMERDGSYIFGSQHYCLGYQPLNQYNWSTTPPISDLDRADFDMDDPFASYPLAQPLLLPTRSHPGFTPQLSPAQHGCTSLDSARLKSCDDFAYFQGGLQSAQRQTGWGLESRPGSRQSRASSGMTKASSVDVKNYPTAPVTSRQSYLGHQDTPQYGNQYFQPDISDSKVSGRKRALSVVAFAKHRKSSSNNATNLRISGPMPIISSNSMSPAGTFSGLSQTPGPSTSRDSLGCLSPAWEEVEDITPIKPSLGGHRSRSGTTSSVEEPKSMRMTHKYSSRPEAKSIWKTLKKTTSRSSMSAERPFNAHQG